MTTSLLAALSAVLYGAGVAMEHRQAARATARAARRGRLLTLLARQPLWLAGAGLEAGGFVLHAAALGSGSLLAVQLILGCSLLVSVSLSSLLTRRRLPRRCWPAIFAIVASVAAIVVLLGPDAHTGGTVRGTAVAAVITGAATLPLAAAGLLATGRRSRPLLLAAAAGTADTCVAVLTMAFAHTLAAHGIGGLATSWPPYALIVGGLASLALTQAAYQTDALLVTLPVISAVTPLASLAVGVLVLHEATHLSVARELVCVLCLVIALTALVVLARAAAALTDAGRTAVVPLPQHPENTATDGSRPAPPPAAACPRRRGAHPAASARKSGSGLENLRRQTLGAVRSSDL